MNWSRRLLSNGQSHDGFSLVEVVISVGVFALAIAAVIALFGPLNRSAAEVSQTVQAARLAEAINVELIRIRDGLPASADSNRAAAFAALLLGDAGSPQGSLRLIGSSDGTRVVRDSEADNPSTALVPGIAPRDRLFVIDVSLQPDYIADSMPHVPVHASVRWPYYLPTGPNDSDAVAADLSNAQRLVFSYAIVP